MAEEDSPLLEDSDDVAEDKPQLSLAKQNCMLVTVLSLQFCSLCANTLIVPFFPKIAMDRGWGTFHTGVVFAAFDMARFIASPIAGSLLLKWHPKSMCAFGNLLTALSCAGFGSVELIKNNDWFLGLCVVMRLCAGIGSAMLAVSATSLLMKATTYKTTTISTLIEIVTGAGYAAGPMYGALLFTVTGYCPMFWILGGLMVLLLPAFIVVVPKVEETGHLTNKSFFDLLSIPGCLLMFLHSFLLKFCNRSPGLSNFFTDKLHKDTSTVSLLFALWSTIYVALGCPFFSMVVKKGFIYKTMVISLFIRGTVSLFIGPSPLFDFIFHGQRCFWLTTAAMAVTYFMAPATFIPIYQATLNLARVSGHQSDSLHTYGMVSGLVNCGVSLGNTVGPVASGLITDATNFPWTNTVFAGLGWWMGILMCVYLLYMHLTNQPLAPKGEHSAIEEGTTAKEGKVTAKDIATACADKFNKLLRSNKKPIKLYHVQEN